MDLELNIKDHVAIVTGAAGQIGSVIVDAFLAAGCCVGALDIDIKKSDKTHSRLHWVQADTTDEDSMKRAWEEVSKQFYGAVPTICVAAAALDLSFVPHHQSITEMPVEQFRRTIDVVRFRLHAP